MKKLVSILLAVMLCAVMIAGCGESASSAKSEAPAATAAATESKSEAAAPAATEEKSEAADKIRIVIWHEVKL